MTLRITSASREIERLLAAHYGIEVLEGTLLEDDEGLSPETQRVCRFFGLAPIKVHYAGDDPRFRFEAMTLRGTDGRLLCVSNHAESPERAVVGHELAHRLRAERPALYNRLAEGLREAGVRKEAFDRHVERQRRQIRLTGEEAPNVLAEHEEFVCDVVGDAVMHPQAWQSLGNIGVLQAFREWVSHYWKRISGQVAASPLGGLIAIEDRNAAVRCVSGLLLEWSSAINQVAAASRPRGDEGMPAVAFRRHGDGQSTTPFYSALMRALELAKGAPLRAAAVQWRQWLDGAQRRGEFRKSEREWIGVDAWLDSRGDGPVARSEVAEFVRANEVQVREVLYGVAPEVLHAIEAAGYGLEECPVDGEVTFLDPDGDAIDFEDLPDELQVVVNRHSFDQAPKYRQHTGMRGEHYRELLLALPSRVQRPPMQAEYAGGGEYAVRTVHEGGRLGSSDRIRAASAEEAIERVWSPNNTSWQVESHRVDFRSSHFKEPNVLVHVRFNERTDAEDKRVLFIEELQSDWHQSGRRRGYKSTRLGQVVDDWRQLDEQQLVAMLAWNDRDGEYVGLKLPEAQECVRFGFIEGEGMTDAQVTAFWNERARCHVGVPDAPFKRTDEWALLAIKRMVRWAAENGFERVAWTPGTLQALRYDLSREIREVHLSGTNLKAYDHDGRTVIEETGVTPENLADYIGKEAAEKLLAQPVHGTLRSLVGEELRVGGKGMQEFYDVILPAAVNKWAKPFGGRVSQTDVKFTDAPWSEYADYAVDHPYRVRNAPRVHCLDVTPAMRDAVLAGMPLFRRVAVGETPEPEAMKP